MKNLDNFFNAKNIAIVGVSKDPNKIGHVIFRNLIDSNFKGKIFAVNRNAESVLNYKSYKSLIEIKEKIDLVVIAIPAEFVIKVIHDCHKIKVHDIVIITSGFGEIGNTLLENKLRDLISKYKIRCVGPNCLGIFDAYTKLDTLFLPRYRLQRPKEGGISFVCQSGAVGSTILDLGTEEGYGFSLGVAGSITRSVRGVPDDYRNIHQRYFLDCNGNPSSIKESGLLFDSGGTILDNEFRENYNIRESPFPYFSECPGGRNTLLGVYGGNPDSFFISLNGEGSEMVIDKNTKQFVLSNIKPWKIGFAYDLNGNNGISEINVYIEDGTKYVFRDIGLKTYSINKICEVDLDPFSGNFGYCIPNGKKITISPTDNKAYTYAWPLVEIRGNNYKDTDATPGPSIGDYGSWVKFEYNVGSYITSSNIGGYKLDPTIFYDPFPPYS